MIGYQALLKEVISGNEFQHLFVYVDAMPLKRTKTGYNEKTFPVGVCVTLPSENPSEMVFHAFYGCIVHVIGGNEERVRAFADKIWEYKPKRIVQNWGDAMEVMQ